MKRTMIHHKCPNRNNNRSWWWIIVLILIVVIWIQYMKWKAIDSLPASNLNGLQPVTTFDLQRYLGQWYEHSRYDQWFERGLNRVQATYSLNPENPKQIIVENRGSDCEKMKYIRGFAVQTDRIGVLAVSFFPFIKSMYVVLYLDANYRYAVVGSPSRKALWFLTRDPQGLIPPTVLQEMNNAAKQNRFDLSLLKTLVYQC